MSYLTKLIYSLVYELRRYIALHVSIPYRNEADNPIKSRQINILQRGQEKEKANDISAQFLYSSSAE